MWRCSRPARTTNILAAAAVRSACVLSSVCVAVFDCDELTCIKLLWLYRKYCHVFLLVRVDPSLSPHSSLEEIQSSRGMLVVTMGWTWGRFALSSQQFRGTGQPAQNTTTLMMLHKRKLCYSSTRLKSRREIHKNESASTSITTRQRVSPLCVKR